MSFNKSGTVTAKINNNSIPGKFSGGFKPGEMLLQSFFPGRPNMNNFIGKDGLIHIALEMNSGEAHRRISDLTARSLYDTKYPDLRSGRYANLDKYHEYETALYGRISAGPYLTRDDFESNLLHWWHFPTATEVLKKLPEDTYIPSLLDWYLDAISGIKPQ